MRHQKNYKDQFHNKLQYDHLKQVSTYEDGIFEYHQVLQKILIEE